MIKLRYLVQEMGRTVRSALQSWPMTVRLCVLIVVCVAAIKVSAYYHH
jgi:hypothetical protein